MATLEEDWDKAVQNLLAADTALAAVVAGVYVGVAPQAGDSGVSDPFPYVVIARTDFGEYSDSDHTGHEVLMDIETFSRSPGQKECRQVQGLIRAALHRQESGLSVTGYSVLTIDRDGSTVEEIVDADGSFRGVCTYRALVTRNAAD